MPFQFRFKLSANPIDPQQNASSNLSIQLDQVAPCVVEHFTTQAQLALVANTHAVNPSKRSAKFAIDENTTARLVVELSSTNSIYRFQNRFDSSTSSRHSINSPLSTKHLPLPTPPTTTKTTPARFPISAQNSPIANFLQKLTH